MPGSNPVNQSWVSIGGDPSPAENYSTYTQRQGYQQGILQGRFLCAVAGLIGGYETLPNTDLLGEFVLGCSHDSLGTGASYSLVWNLKLIVAMIALCLFTPFF